jgi:hypothetical protein
MKPQQLLEDATPSCRRSGCFAEELHQIIPYYDERRPEIRGWAQVKYTYVSGVEAAYKKLEYFLF